MPTKRKFNGRAPRAPAIGAGKSFEENVLEKAKVNIAICAPANLRKKFELIRANARTAPPRAPRVPAPLPAPRRVDPWDRLIAARDAAREAAEAERCQGCHWNVHDPRVPEKVSDKRMQLRAEISSTLRRYSGVARRKDSSKKSASLQGQSMAIMVRIVGPTLGEPVTAISSLGYCHSRTTKTWTVRDADAIARWARLELGGPRAAQVCRGPAKLLGPRKKEFAAIIPPMKIVATETATDAGAYRQKLMVFYRVAHMNTTTPFNLRLPATLGARARARARSAQPRAHQRRNLRAARSRRRAQARSRRTSARRSSTT